MNDRKNRRSPSTRESEELNRKALQALPFHVAVIDREGCILTVNDAWTNFALNNEAGGSPSVKVGANYCAVCRRAAADRDLGAAQALEGIEAVLNGELEQFSMEYPCHSAQQQRWFLMTVVPLDRGGSGAVITHIDISPRKETEESLKAGENRLRLALSAARMASWDWHVPSGDVNWNEMQYRILGYEPGEVQPSYRAWASRVHPGDLDAVENELHRCMAERGVYTAEFRVIWPDGTIRWLEARGDFVYDDNGQPINNYGVVLDVTERKVAEQALKESEALYRSIGESIDYGVWVCSPDGRNTYASESFLKMVGFTQEQCSDFGWGDVLHPDDAERTIAAWQECVRTGSIWDIEHRFRGVDGQWHHVLARGVPVRNEQGEIFCWAGINLDISRLKQAEESLDRHLAVLDGINGVLAAALTRQSEEDLGVACLEIAQKITQSRFGFIGFIKEDRLVDIAITNPGWEACTITNGSGHHPPLASFRIHGIYGRVLTDGKALFSNDPAHHPDRIGLPAGHPALEAFLGVPLIHEGRTTGLIAVANRPGGYTAAEQEALETLAPAIVEAFMRKRAEDAQKKSQERLSQALTAARMASWDWHVPSGDVDWNETHYRMMGYEPGEVQPTYQAWANRVHPDDVEATQSLIQRAMDEHQGYTTEFRTLWPDGTVRWLEARGDFEYTANNQPLRCYGVMLDITERRQAEDNLRESEERLRFHMENSPLAVIEWDREFIVTRWTGEAERLFGWSAAETVGRKLSDLNMVFEDDMPIVSATMLKLTDGQSRQVVATNRNFTRSGEIRHCTWYNSVLLDRQGQMRSVLSQIIDITDRINAEEALRKAHDELEQRVQERNVELETVVDILKVEIAERRKAEKELETSARKIEDLYNFAPCGYHSLDKDGTIVRINATELGWLGYEQDEVVGKMKTTDMLTADSQADFANNFSRLTSGNDLYDLRLRFIRKDGSILPVLLNAIPIMDDDGNYLMSRSTIYDITDLVQAEESIRRLNLLYLTLSETGRAIAHSSNREHLFQEICRIVVEYGGFKMAWIGLVNEASELVVPVAAFGDGTDFLDNIRVSVLQEPEGMGPTGTAIREGSSYICNTFLADPRTAPWQHKAGQRGFLASASLAIKLHGTAIGALTMYASTEGYFDPQIVELLMQMQEDIAFALDNLDREEQRLRMEQALRDETLERLRAVESLREQEQMLIQQSRQAAMGEMIGNIAHQWRQPLNTLGLFTQRLGFFYGSPSFTKEFLDTSVAKSMEIIQYMSRTIDDFRSFFSIDREKSDFRADEAVDKVLSLVEASFNECRINLEREEKKGIIINGFPNEYAQVLLNIFINAKDAIIERQVASPRIKVTIDTENGTSVVTIADNAGGISEEIIGKIFDPYFTTKGPQQGTGVGLFMSKAIIENNMGGRLTVRNTDLGAEFRIEV